MSASERAADALLTVREAGRYSGFILSAVTIGMRPTSDPRLVADQMLMADSHSEVRHNRGRQHAQRTHRRARVPYIAGSGREANIPLGPCLVERIDDQLVDVIWGAKGQKSTMLPMKDLEAATVSGNIILLD